MGDGRVSWPMAGPLHTNTKAGLKLAGRIYETDSQNVGAYVFRDFVRNRRKRLH
ncbi:MAG: hypothetical protein ABL977_02550 [Candidatus Eisenbacteria bacterium]